MPLSALSPEVSSLPEFLGSPAASGDGGAGESGADTLAFQALLADARQQMAAAGPTGSKANLPQDKSQVDVLLEQEKSASEGFENNRLDCFYDVDSISGATDSDQEQALGEDAPEDDLAESEPLLTLLPVQTTREISVVQTAATQTKTSNPAGETPPVIARGEPELAAASALSAPPQGGKPLPPAAESAESSVAELARLLSGEAPAEAAAAAPSARQAADPQLDQGLAQARRGQATAAVQSAAGRVEGSSDLGEREAAVTLTPSSSSPSLVGEGADPAAKQAKEGMGAAATTFARPGSPEIATAIGERSPGLRSPGLRSQSSSVAQHAAGRADMEPAVLPSAADTVTAEFDLIPPAQQASPTSAANAPSAATAAATAAAASGAPPSAGVEAFQARSARPTGASGGGSPTGSAPTGLREGGLVVDEAASIAGQKVADSKTGRPETVVDTGTAAAGPVKPDVGTGGASVPVMHGLPVHTTPTPAAASAAVSSFPLQADTPFFDELFANQVYWQVNQKLSQAEIQLDPPELGPLAVRILQEGQDLRIQFTAAHPQTREQIEQALPRLRELFEAGGLQLAQVDVQDGRRGQGDRRELPEPRASSAASRGMGTGEEPKAEARRQPVRAYGLVDTYA